MKCSDRVNVNRKISLEGYLEPEYVKICPAFSWELQNKTPQIFYIQMCYIVGFDYEGANKIAIML